MTVSTTSYNLFKKRMLNGNAVDFTTGTLKLTLHTSTYTPNVDTHEYYSDLTNELATAGGYISGGKTLTTLTVGMDTAGNFGYADADDVIWTALTATFRYAVLWKSTGVAATSPLVLWIDFGENQTPAGVDYTVRWSAPTAGGLLQFA